MESTLAQYVNSARRDKSALRACQGRQQQRASAGGYTWWLCHLSLIRRPMACRV